ncbi:MerC domain-containing protein [Novosphingobium lindaniclasticum]|uniref:MerC mercury resistance protein n=1 Tax=Novosphingobium lindaniclasticum LE124 TaxID=1096930 RepID=T0IYE3_9SPHN|nr:MerC family mercury resistance protein [Novosphingobium lindaniclasticum]EQB16885.1 hypothetical protein L284_08840 [Novosphingobium lindaniclasticum LE124]
MSEQCETLDREPGRFFTDFVESAAISASTLCMIHCLALPLLLFLLPGLLGTFFQSELFHIVALGLVVPAALAAFLLGYQRHGAVGPALFGVAGIACLVMGVFLPIAPLSEVGLTVAGSALLVAGHAWNWRKRTAQTGCNAMATIKK